MQPSPSDSKNPQPRPFLGIHLKCCNVYVRAYRNAAGDAFTTFCPRCTVPVRIPIATDGTGSRSQFFEAS